MKTLLSKKIDCLRQGLFGFKLRVYLRVKILSMAVLSQTAAFLEKSSRFLKDKLRLRLTLEQIHYQVHWHYVVTEDNVEQVREKVPYNKIRRLLQPGDRVWCASGYKSGEHKVGALVNIPPTRYVFYFSATRKSYSNLHYNAKVPIGAVGWKDRFCSEGNWIDNDHILLDDNTVISVNGHYLLIGDDPPSWWTMDMNDDSGQDDSGLAFLKKKLINS